MTILVEIRFDAVAVGANRSKVIVLESPSDTENDDSTVLALSEDRARIQYVLLCSQMGRPVFLTHVPEDVQSVGPDTAVVEAESQ